MKKLFVLLTIAICLFFAGNALADKLVATQSGRATYNVVDEDDMTSDSVISIPTQQSVKAYVDDKDRSTAVQLPSVFVDGSGPITSSTAPNCTTIDNVAAIVYDESAEVAEIQFTHAATDMFEGLEIEVSATGSLDDGTVQALDWSIFVYDDGSALGTAVAQTGASFTEVSMATLVDSVTLTLDATGITAVTAGTSVIHIAIWNNGNSAGTLEIKGIKVKEL